MNWRRWLTACVLGACGCSSAPADTLGEHAAAIVEGQPSGADQDSVVLLRTIADEGELLCSGTLVAPNLVLTARHCVSHLGLGLFTCSVRGELIEVEEGAGRLGAHLPAEEIEIFGREAPRSDPLAKGQQVLSTLSSTVCTNDLAFLVLDREVDLPVSPLRLAGPAMAKESAILVGYGMDGVQEVLEYRTAPRLQKTDIAVVAVGPNAVEDVIAVPPRAVVIAGVSGCTGDSGGPLLAASSGAVLGVYSLQDGGDCTDPKVKHLMVHVPAFSGLIQQAFDAAGHQPVPEPLPGDTPGAGGAAGAGAEAGAAASETVAGESSGGAGGAAPSEPPVAPPNDEPSSSCAFTSQPTQARGGALLLVLLAAFGVRRSVRVASRR